MDDLIYVDVQLGIHKKTPFLYEMAL